MRESWAILEQRAKYAQHCGNPVEVGAAELLDLIELARNASQENALPRRRTVIGQRRGLRRANRDL